MRKTILTCDRCKEVVDNLHDVGAGLRVQRYGSYTSPGNLMEVTQLTAEWCTSCCIEMHIVKPGKESDAIPSVTPPTLEDMIREIIREEVRE